MQNQKDFDTNIFFSGGAGMFIQYHDIVKPVYLYAIIKMILTGESFGLPINIINSMSIFSIIEWYMNRRYINPFKNLDYKHTLSDEELDKMLLDYIKNDPSIYSLAPSLNISSMLDVYNQQHMTFPVYIYSKEEEPAIKQDCQNVFHGIPVRYVYGDLENAIKKCDQNFTYIFSDIDLVKEACKILLGTCSHVLLSSDYRYNYIDNRKTFKYDLTELGEQYPFVRIGTTMSTDIARLAVSFKSLMDEFIQEGD
jgi:hypothetical protein